VAVALVVEVVHLLAHHVGAGAEPQEDADVLEHRPVHQPVPVARRDVGERGHQDLPPVGVRGQDVLGADGGAERLGHDGARLVPAAPPAEPRTAGGTGVGAARVAAVSGAQWSRRNIPFTLSVTWSSFSFMPPAARSTLPSRWRSRSPLRSPIASLARPFALSILSSAMRLLPEVAPATRGSRRRPSRGTRRPRGADQRSVAIDDGERDHPLWCTVCHGQWRVDPIASTPTQGGRTVSDHTPPPPPDRKS